MWIALQKVAGGQDHSRGAVSALDRPVPNKGYLEGVQLFRCGQSFQGQNPSSLQLGGQHEAGQPALPVHQDGAAAAFAQSAAFLDAGQPQVFPQHPDHWTISRDIQAHLLFIEGEFYVQFNPSLCCL